MVAPTKRDTHLSETGNSEGISNNVTHFEVLRGRDGRDGQNGSPGPAGRDGSPGPAGRDGLPGPGGRDGSSGPAGKEGKDGKDGRDGKDGEVGETGEPGNQGPPGPPGPSSGGVVYTRWGRTTCPDTPGTELVYAGMAGGTRHNTQGGASNHLCMPKNPDYLQYTPGVQDNSPVRGADYRTNLLSSVHDHDAPCAVCLASARETVLMIPAKTQCPPSWTLEYTGYLMSAHVTHYRSVFECIDKDPERVPGSAAATLPALFYHAEATCSELPCPPYDPQKELTCVVCTK